jgi:hypothetical protein
MMCSSSNFTARIGILQDLFGDGPLTRLSDDKVTERPVPSPCHLVIFPAERGFINGLSERLEHLEHRTPFDVGEKVRAVIEDMRHRDLQRKLAQD